ncbi:MAG: phosphonate ABC transporter ATP-binding protein [Nitrospinota bacterium]
MPLLEARALSVRYPGGACALRGVDLSVAEGEFITLIGPSGAGKTTLLRCLHGLVLPTGGEVLLERARVNSAGRHPLGRVPRQVGMVFQQFNLVKRASALTNILSGRLGAVGTLWSLLGWFPREDVRYACLLLREVGLGNKERQRVESLSGGEQQRVAIARALMQRPRVILADEPMASLDWKLARAVLEMLREVNLRRGVTVVACLHVVDLAREYGRRLVGLREGRVVFDGSPESLGQEALERIYGAGGPPSPPPGP